jgi:nucleotide-binding universal stress UspA family protein
MINHVLIPLDGSQLAEKALDAAKQVLRQQGRMTLVTAVSHPTPPLYPYPSADVVHEIQSDIEYMENANTEMQEYLDRVAKNLTLNGYSVEIEIVQGEASDVIVERAETLRADIIVMSTHGHSGLERLLFGSVTNRVLGAAYCPVLVVPNRERVSVVEPTTVPSSDPSPAV